MFFCSCVLKQKPPIFGISANIFFFGWTQYSSSLFFCLKLNLTAQKADCRNHLNNTNVRVFHTLWFKCPNMWAERSIGHWIWALIAGAGRWQKGAGAKSRGRQGESYIMVIIALCAHWQPRREMVEPVGAECALGGGGSSLPDNWTHS